MSNEWRKKEDSIERNLIEKGKTVDQRKKFLSELKKF